MFECPSNLDPAVRAHIESFYRAADGETTTGVWASHFTEDGIAKKSPDEVKGREGRFYFLTQSTRCRQQGLIIRRHSSAKMDWLDMGNG